MRYLFEDYAFDTNLRELYCGANIVAVTPQVFDLLEYLIRHRARVVSKNDLINAIWSGRSVSDAALTTRLNVARNAIGDSGGEQRLIKTLPRRGFRFIGQVRAAQEFSRIAGYDNPIEAPKATLPLPDKPSVADLPFTNLSGDAEQEYLADLLTGSPARERKERSRREIDQEVARKAALAYEKWRRDAESRKEEAARENARQRRERTIEKVQAALDKAEREHTRRVDVIEARAQAEDARWHKQKSELEKALRRASSSSKER
ncbi:winged helix-turn-helix domain-containing protein [Bradyrhizobium sp. CB3481]|uniref:winged helix-turn-helix domain-containing protein n=1 Tax=Bradyrhizobium sp. CB3481 TaxID=3039158 RepID=UPI0032C231EC